MATHSGKSGTLTIAGSEETPVMDWELTITSANDSFAANNTGGAKDRVAGVQDASGTFNMADVCSVVQGALIALVLYTGEQIYTLNAIIDLIGITTDINDGTKVVWAVAFSARQAVTKTTGSYSG